MRRMLPLLALSMGLTACTATHMAYVYDASVGIDLAYSNEGNGKLIFGYDRGTYALVPQKKDEEIMSLSAVSKVKATGIDDLDFSHFIATGDAAKAVAKDPTGLKQIRTAIFGKED